MVIVAVDFLSVLLCTKQSKYCAPNNQNTVHQTIKQSKYSKQPKYAS